MEGLTPRQAEVYSAIKAITAEGQPPSLEQLAERVGMASTWAVRRHLGILEKKGFLAPRRLHARRNIKLAEQSA